MLEYDRHCGGLHLLRIHQLTGIFLWQRGHMDVLAYRICRTLVHIPLSFTLSITIVLGAVFTKGGDSLYMSCIMIAMMVKILSMWRNDLTAFEYVEELAHSPELQLRNATEVRRWQSEALSFRRITSAYLILCSSSVFTSTMGVLFLSTYEMPYDFWVPFDYRNPQYYWYCFGFQCVAMVLSYLSNGTMDMSCCYFMFHLAQWYKVLGWRFEAMQLDEKPNDSKVVDELKRLIDMHRLLKRLTRTCETIVGTMILTQIILSSFIICFLAYRLTLVNFAKNAKDMLVIVQLFGIMVVQIYLPCYYANEVTYHSNRLTDKVFASNWLNWSVGTQKLVYNFMENLKRPCVIKAGTFFNVGLPIFGKTMNNAYSLFAVLLNMGK